MVRHFCSFWWHAPPRLDCAFWRYRGPEQLGGISNLVYTQINEHILFFFGHYASSAQETSRARIAGYVITLCYSITRSKVIPPPVRDNLNSFSLTKMWWPVSSRPDASPVTPARGVRRAGWGSGWR